MLFSFVAQLILFLFLYLWDFSISCKSSTKGYVKVCSSSEQTIIKLGVSSISLIGFQHTEGMIAIEAPWIGFGSSLVHF